MIVYVGTSGYAYDEWKGGFYPEKTSSKQMLPFYSERLNAVEINNTLYRIPNESVLRSWAEQVPEGFLFSLKASQRITHIKRPKDVSSEMGHLFRMLRAMGDKLGPVLSQLPANFKRNMPRLQELLELIPTGFSCAFAFRNAEWHNPETSDLLRGRNHGICLEDEAPVDGIVSTASWGYIRLRRSDYSEADLSEWAARVLSQKWGRAFVFFKHEAESSKSPHTTVRFRELCGQ